MTAPTNRPDLETVRQGLGAASPGPTAFIHAWRQVMEPCRQRDHPKAWASLSSPQIRRWLHALEQDLEARPSDQLNSQTHTHYDCPNPS